MSSADGSAGKGRLLPAARTAAGRLGEVRRIASCRPAFSCGPARKPRWSAPEVNHRDTWVRRIWPKWRILRDSSSYPSTRSLEGDRRPANDREPIWRAGATLGLNAFGALAALRRGPDLASTPRGRARPGQPLFAGPSLRFSILGGLLPQPMLALEARLEFGIPTGQRVSEGKQPLVSLASRKGV